MFKSHSLARIMLSATLAAVLVACAAPAPRPTPDPTPPPAEPAPKPAPPSSPVSQEVADELVAAHNFWRNQVKVAPLEWSDELAQQARDWALTLLRRGSMEHRPDNAHGENIAWFAGERMRPSDVVDYWGNEVEYYDPEKNACLDGTECSHYTQIVWQDTKAVGCAPAWGEHPNYGIQEFWVCNYNPPGNVEGLRPY